MLFKIIISSSFLLTLILFSCGGDNTGTGPGNIAFPDSNLSFTQHIRPIFLDNCVQGNCHGGFRAGGLDLESDPPDFQSNSGLVVIPFSKTNSLLYILLFVSDNGIPRMPPDRISGILDAEITAIGTWIDEGANPAN